MAPRPNGPAWLYRLFDEAGTLLYVGVTRRPWRRLYEHQSSRRFSSTASASWTHFNDGADAYAEEIRVIRRERPTCNVILYANQAAS